MIRFALTEFGVVGQVLATNPAHAVRGPKYVVKRGKTPVLAEDQARRLIEQRFNLQANFAKLRQLLGEMIEERAVLNIQHQKTNV